jgi:hypothetical protein
MMTPAERVARIQADLLALSQTLPSLCPEDSEHAPYSVSVGMGEVRVHLPFGAFMDAHMSGTVTDVSTNESHGSGKPVLHYTGTAASTPEGTKVYVVACEHLPDAPSPDAPSPDALSPDERAPASG